MAGELATLSTNAGRYYVDGFRYADNLRAWVNSHREPSGPDAYAKLTEVSGQMLDMAEWMGNIEEAVRYLKTYGLWASNMELIEFQTALNRSISNGLSDVRRELSGVSQSVTDAVEATVNTIPSLIEPDIDEMARTIKAGISSTVNDLRDSISGVVNSVSSTVSYLKDQIAADVDDVQRIVTEKISGSQSDLEKAILDAQGAISAGLSDAQTALETAIFAVTGAIEGKIEDLRLKTEATFLQALEPLRILVVGLGDDVALKVWTYFRDFFFEREE